jgi:pyrimidine deaminase RibD-like protein
VWGARLTLPLALTAMVIAVSVSAVLGSGRASGASQAGSVVLGSGEIAGVSWSASVGREHGAVGAKQVAELQPCLGINSSRIGGGKGGETCTFRSRLTPEGAGLWITSSEPNDGGSDTAMTAVAMVFAPVVASVKASLVGGGVETIGLRRLSQEQARATGLGRLRYAVFATTGAWCVARLESFDRAGHRLWRSVDLRKRSCPAGS